MKILKQRGENFHPEVEAQLIKVSSEDEAKEIKSHSMKGATLLKSPKKKSTDEATKEKGGEITFDSQSTSDAKEKSNKQMFKLKMRKYLMLSQRLIPLRTPRNIIL